MPNAHTVTPRIAVALVAAMLSTACFTSETLIRIKADGSGTIEQTHLMNSQMIGMATAMAGAAAKEAGATGNLDLNPSEIFSEEQLRRQAAEWGENVRFVSYTPLEQGPMKGVAAVFAFDDVNALSMGARSRAGAAPTPAGPPMQFGLSTVAGRSVLSVTFPEGTRAEHAPSSPGAAPNAPPQIPPEALAMVKSMFDGARLSVAVEVAGRILASNAPFTSGSRATLVELDFGELLSDPSKLSALQTLKPGVDFSTVRKTLEGVKGVKLPTHSVVSIEFAK